VRNKIILHIEKEEKNVMLTLEWLVAFAVETALKSATLKYK
jgi:hypothetical protein